jgi:hypothetical protein
MSKRTQASKRASTSRDLATTASTGKPGVQATRLAQALAALAHGLPNPWDESTDYFHAFAAVMPASTKLDADSFREALRIGTRYEIALSPADQRLTDMGNAVDDWGEDIAGGFKQLGVVMRSTLTDLSIAYARGKGVVRVRVWLFGRTADGTIVGLRSMSTET